MAVIWRTRAAIQAHATFGGAEFFVGGARITARPERRGDDWPAICHIVDVLLEPSADCRDTHVRGLDALGLFMDRVAVLTYAPCALLNVISTCPVRVDVGVEFEMVTQDLWRELSSPALEQWELEAFECVSEDSPVHEAAHHVRRALSNSSSDQHLLHLHIAAKRIALGETEERVHNKCPSCNHEWDGPPASRRAMRRLLAGRGITSRDANDAIAYRGKIAHGGGRRDFAFWDRTTELAGSIEGAVMSIVPERAGVRVRRKHGVVVGPPITRHAAVKEADGTFALVRTTWVAPIRFPSLGDDVSNDEGRELAGFPTDATGKPRIDPAAWPD